jgi:hypothetical protein
MVGTDGVVEDTSTGSGVGLDQEILVGTFFSDFVFGPHLVFES